MTKYPVDIVLHIVNTVINRENRNVKFILDGHVIRINTDTLKTFVKNGIVCRGCGIEGKYFVVEKTYDQIDSHALHLYAIDKYGNPVLMTKDHIFPKSKGGKDTFVNYQTMCSTCNNRKGNVVYESGDPRENQCALHGYQHALQNIRFLEDDSFVIQS